MRNVLDQRIAQCEAFQTAQPGAKIDYVVQHGLEGINLGILQLVDGQTLGIEITEGAIKRRGEKIADIPSLDVLKSNDVLIAHLNATTNLQVVSLDL